LQWFLVGRGMGRRFSWKVKFFTVKNLKKINETETSSIKIFEIFNATQVFEVNN